VSRRADHVALQFDDSLVFSVDMPTLRRSALLADMEHTADGQTAHLSPEHGRNWLMRMERGHANFNVVDL
jgi:hypothetical protein